MFQLLRGFALVPAMLLGCGASIAEDTHSANFVMPGCREVERPSYTAGYCMGIVSTLAVDGLIPGICPR